MLAIAAVTALVVTGCQPNGGTNADTEALKEQIAQLEQQIVALEQQAANDNAPKENTLEQAGTASDVGAQPTQDAAAGNSTLKMTHMSEMNRLETKRIRNRKMTQVSELESSLTQIGMTMHRHRLIRVPDGIMHPDMMKQTVIIRLSLMKTAVRQTSRALP